MGCSGKRGMDSRGAHVARRVAVPQTRRAGKHAQLRVGSVRTEDIYQCGCVKKFW